MSSRTSLFLHYGPGGNSQVEEYWLKDQYPNILFWDLPKVAEGVPSFEGFLKSYIAKIEELFSEKPITLVGHSFGCDFALELVQRIPDKISNVILISPIRHIPTAFSNLSETLLQRKSENSLKDANQKLIQSLNEQKDLSENFWGAVGEIVKHPNFLDSYWQDAEIFKKYQDVAAKVEALDFPVWQKVLGEYILSSSSAYSGKMEKPTQVVLGRNDPYYSFEKEIEFWKNILPSEDIVSLDRCGHYPHLEQDCLKHFKL